MFEHHSIIWMLNNLKAFALANQLKTLPAYTEHIAIAFYVHTKINISNRILFFNPFDF